MASNIASNLNTFCRNGQRLQQILEETKRCFDDINNSGQSDGVHLITAELSQEEEAEIVSTATKPPGIVVFGQNPYAKCRIVNEIFKKKILPDINVSDYESRFRMVYFRHGKNLTISLALSDDYELADHLEAYNGPCDTVPQKDIAVQEDEKDLAWGSAVLEISINHPLLHLGGRVIVSPSNHGGDVEEIIKKCIEDVSPILVYVFETDTLSVQQEQELRELQTLTNYQPMIFVRVPPPGFQTINSDPPDGAPGTPPGFQTINSDPPDGAPGTPPGFQTINSDPPDGAPGTPPGFQTINSDPPDGAPGTPPGFQTINSDPPDGAPGTPPGFQTINSDPPDGAPGTTNRLIHQTCFKEDEEKNAQLGQTSPFQANDGFFSHSTSNHGVGKGLKRRCSSIFYHLCHLGYLSDTPGEQNLSDAMNDGYFTVNSQWTENYEDFSQTFDNFSHQVLQQYLINSSRVLNNCHIRCLSMFILSAFDMAREMLITPKKLKFVQEKEEELFTSLMQMTVDNLDHVKSSIAETIHNMHDSLIEKAIHYEFIGVDFTEDGEILTAKGLKICTWQIKGLMLGALNQAIAGKLVSTINKLQDAYTGTLSRCLESLESKDIAENASSPTTKALKQILHSAYQVEIPVGPKSSQLLFERMKQVMRSMPWSTTPKIDTEWKKRVASQMIKSLSEARLARSISSQIKERLNKSHKSFIVALDQLEQRHCGRLDKIQEERLKLKKIHAPRLAKAALESTSLKDVIQYGTPKLGKEIGRGMYGVVYACEKWSCYGPCAVKSVVPPDDAHWNDLALEFYYTKNIPEHDRIVCLRGSVIDYTYAGGSSPAVLLIMDRLQKDLFLAIKQGMDWCNRLQVSCDVVDGIRFLHSQGLVHRDIKLKNVLLDKKNRGKITDLGFCKPEAMMSGSIVGTPIHMAPELFDGKYDNSVDVYAFGILFWYVCSDQVQLPFVFRKCVNKDHLWEAVKKGMRPEKRPLFDDDCWNLMQECWQEIPANRPLLGDVEQQLKIFHDQYKSNPTPEPAKKP